MIFRVWRSIFRAISSHSCFNVNQEPPVNLLEIILTDKIINTGRSIDSDMVSNAVQKAFRIKANDIQGDLTVEVTSVMYSVSTTTILNNQPRMDRI